LGKRQRHSYYTEFHPASGNEQRESEGNILRMESSRTVGAFSFYIDLLLAVK